MSSHILDIPNELLGEIFTYAPRSLRSHLSDINRLTLVCKLWREVAISTPSIWCNIPLHCPRRTSLYLERSKDALLYVHAKADSSVDAIQLALAELRRIKILRLKFSQFLLLRLMETFHTNTKAPSARFLEHLYVERLRSYMFPDLQLTSSLLPNFLCERLVSLDLENIDMPTKLPVFSTLTSLSLHYPPLRQTWDDFADIFKATPVLKTLALKGRSSPVPNDFTPQNAGAIRLPHLADFRLIEVYPPAHCAAMMDQMEYPSGVLPNISMPAVPGLDFAPLFKHCSYLGRSEHSLSTSLMVSYAGDYFSVSLYSRASRSLFRVHGFPKDDEVSGILESACASLNLAQVWDLSIDIQVPLKFSLNQCFPSRLLTSVQEMHVSHRLTEVIELLNPHTPNSPLNTSLTGIPFPQLESLSLHRCSVTNRDVEYLAGICSQRNNLGCGVRRICIWERQRYNALSRTSFSLLQAQSRAILSPRLFLDDLDQALAPSPDGLPPLSPTVDPSEATNLQSRTSANSGPLLSLLFSIVAALLVQWLLSFLI